MVKYLANFLTACRIGGAVTLLFLKPFSPMFFTVYTLCGISDVVDGPIARKSGNATRFGAALDSIADLIFIVMMMVILVPVLPWRPWMLCWIGMIVVIRLFSFVVGGIRFRTLAFLHTYANKTAGAILFLLPFLYDAFGLAIPCAIICTVGTLSAVEELSINIQAPVLDRDIPHIGKLYKTTASKKNQ